MDRWVESVRQFLMNRQANGFRACQENPIVEEGTEHPMLDYLQMRNEDVRASLPQNLLEAYDFYVRYVEQKDFGSPSVYQETIQGRTVLVVDVGTDGSNGWCEIFDVQGEPLGAARTSQERMAWGDVDVIRSYVHNGGMPTSLRVRREKSGFLSETEDLQISQIVQKWKRIFFSTEVFNRDRASNIVTLAYGLSGVAVKPEIIFFDGPYTALDSVFNLTRKKISEELNTFPDAEFTESLRLNLQDQFDTITNHRIFRDLLKQLEEEVLAQVDLQLQHKMIPFLQDSLWQEHLELLLNLLETKLAKAVYEEFQSHGASWSSIFGIVRKQIRQAITGREFFCARALTLDQWH
jgi:hypothetical protein